MNFIETSKEYFSSHYKKHGNHVNALGWGSKESQFKRFSVLHEVGIKDGDSILDVGCGFGDFRSFLAESCNTDYIGIDMNSDFIEIAKSKHPNSKFYCTSLSEYSGHSCDWVVASGIFSFETEDWFNYVKDSIDSMLSLSTKGVAVNFLSSQSIKDCGIGLSKFVDPSLAIKYFTTLTPTKFCLRHDYLGHDFTLYLYR
jgi:cyclopropane fatty-acyl-phospholipid synthase-like methyltransferase